VSSGGGRGEGWDGVPACVVEGVGGEGGESLVREVVGGILGSYAWGHTGVVLGCRGRCAWFSRAFWLLLFRRSRQAVSPPPSLFLSFFLCAVCTVMRDWLHLGLPCILSLACRPFGAPLPVVFGLCPAVPDLHERSLLTPACAECTCLRCLRTPSLDEAYAIKSWLHAAPMMGSLCVCACVSVYIPRMNVCLCVCTTYMSASGCGGWFQAISPGFLMFLRGSNSRPQGSGLGSRV